MKLNFDYCKTCDAQSKFFSNSYYSYIGLNFFCSKCGFFVFDGRFEEERFCKAVNIEKISNEEWFNIYKLEILKYNTNFFNKNCPRYFEHLVES